MPFSLAVPVGHVLHKLLSRLGSVPAEQAMQADWSRFATHSGPLQSAEELAPRGVKMQLCPAHTLHLVEPGSANLPAKHCAQSAVGSSLYRPAEHCVQLEAPSRASVSVTEPCTHISQFDVEMTVYCPGLHAVQLTAPVAVSVLVMCPGGHSAQSTVGSELYRPAEHAVQETAPGFLRVSVVDPG